MTPRKRSQQTTRRLPFEIPPRPTIRFTPRRRRILSIKSHITRPIFNENPIPLRRLRQHQRQPRQMQRREIQTRIKPQMRTLRQRPRFRRLPITTLRRRRIHTSPHIRHRHRQRMINHPRLQIFKRNQTTHQRQRRRRRTPPRHRTRPHTRPKHPTTRRHILHRPTPSSRPTTSPMHKPPKFPQPIRTRLPNHKLPIRTHSRPRIPRQRHRIPRRLQRRHHRTVIQHHPHRPLPRPHRIHRHAITRRINPRTSLDAQLVRDLRVERAYRRG